MYMLDEQQYADTDYKKQGNNLVPFFFKTEENDKYAWRVTRKEKVFGNVLFSVKEIS